MKTVALITTLFALHAAAAAGCAPDGKPEPATDTSPVAVQQAAMAPPITRLPPEKALETERGEATFYPDRFEGRRTASGAPLRQNEMVASHRTHPFGTLLRVTNLRNDRSVNVRVVDRGPFGSSAEARGTVVDLSRRAAQRLGYIDAGRASVQVEVLEWGNGVPRTQ